MDRKAWRAAVHGVAKSRKWLKPWTTKRVRVEINETGNRKYMKPKVDFLERSTNLTKLLARMTKKRKKTWLPTSRMKEEHHYWFNKN